MYEILLVDDEILSRNNLKYLFSSIGPHFHVCGEAANGREALALLKSIPSDIVITDMKMPEMDGLELIKELRRRYPLINIIALSNYDDIDYVRSSLKYGIIDYWLKHEVSIDLIERTFSQFDIQAKCESSDAGYARKNLQEIQRKFVISLLSGVSMSSQDVQTNAAILGFPVFHTAMLPAILHINHYTKHMQDKTLENTSIFEFTILNIVSEIFSSLEYALIINLAPEDYCLFFSLPGLKSETAIFSCIREYAELAANALRKFLNIEVTISMGKLCYDYKKLPDSFRNAEIKNKNKFYDSPNIIYTQTPEYKKSSSLGLPYTLERSVSTALKLTNRPQIIHALDEVYSYIDQENLDISGCQRVFFDLYNIAALTCKIDGLVFEEVCSPTITVHDIFSGDYRLPELKEMFRTCFLHTANALSHECTDSEYVNQALAIIHEKYNMDITLYTIADDIGISSAYLSTVFKQAVGTGFSQYLNKYRINKAVIYLENGNRNLHEIALQCGYQNYDYFFKVFKRVTGMTPGMYIEHHDFH